MDSLFLHKYRKTVKRIKIWVSNFLYMVALMLLSIIRCLIYCFSGIKPIKQIVILVPESIFNKLFYFLFRNFSYYGSDFLQTDLEHLWETGEIREKYAKLIGKYKSQKILKSRKRRKIGFIGYYGSEANFTKDFFYNQPQNIHVTIYEITQRKNSKPSYFLTNNENITYKHVGRLEPWYGKNCDCESIARIINDDDLDLIVNNISSYLLTLVDLLEVPKILSFNTSSLLLPHPKCKYQTYIQPSFPYYVEMNKIKNFRNKKILDIPVFVYDDFIFNRRALPYAKHNFPITKKNTIFYSGNLKKLASKTYCGIIAKLLIRFPDLEFIFYGLDRGNNLNIINDFFREKGVFKKIKYKGSYSYNENQKGKVLIAQKDLVECRLVINPFPISAARSIIEAYIAQVPVIHLDIPMKKWERDQNLQPFKLPLLITESGSAKDIDGLFFLSSVCVYNKRRVRQIITEQNKILSYVCSGKRFWGTLMSMLT